MMQTLFTWWRERSQREQRMLAALGVLFAAMLVWFAAFGPLADAIDARRSRHAALAADLSALRAVRAVTPVPRADRPVAEIVAASAASAGLEFTATRPLENGVLVTIAAVKPIFLFGWIATLERDAGVVATRVSVQRNDDATVSAEVGFAGSPA